LSDAKEIINYHLVLIEEELFAVCCADMSTKFPAEIISDHVLGSAGTGTAHIDKL
jgi:hypothetical protein